MTVNEFLRRAMKLTGADRVTVTVTPDMEDGKCEISCYMGGTVAYGMMDVDNLTDDATLDEVVNYANEGRTKEMQP